MGKKRGGGDCHGGLIAWIGDCAQDILVEGLEVEGGGKEHAQRWALSLDSKLSDSVVVSALEPCD